MGLDNYASRTPGDVSLTGEDERAFSAAGIELCGGIMSGGESSFRGKIYWDLVYEVTGESIMEEWIPPETVVAMAEKLNALTPEELADINDRVRPYRSEHATSPNEMESLQCFFTICAGRGLGIVGWW